MKNVSVVVTMLAMAGSVAMHAQTAGTTSAQSSRSAGQVTVTGCLQGDSASSSSASTGSMGGFVLTRATDGATSGSAASTTGTTGTTSRNGSMSASDHSYRLEGHDSELKNHVGHRIEVTGTLDQSQDRSSSAATSTTTSGSASTRTSGGVQRLNVSSVRMIAQDCSAR
jgi:hypothetical protein